ncbi:Ribosomal RNA small subunit methyltransferase I [Tepidimonas alkaliphilus]|uniref:Ribosomal RNA small subunit methyltransferase I n=1 Tax=Tepidimonas alkaliphilus TaxID=2588942 RepID=A0A554WBK0_9BURK|nr:Ribosomal RNA small subunit methyltransferase I [Tepidimonas alkaliphilus]
MVATPIGNRADITLRALHVLALADAVACEDTRRTAQLLAGYGLQRPLLALHEHNEASAASAVVERLRAGQRIAYVSDAGTPGISDPGARLCAAVQAAGLRCAPVPGASSVTALLSVAGLTDGAVTLVGFLPAQGRARAEAWQRWAAVPTALLLLEAPHRIDRLAGELAALGSRRVTVGRELTKQFEEIVTLPCAQLPGWLATDPQRRKGEFTLLLHPFDMDQRHDHEVVTPEVQRVLSLLLEELPPARAARLAAKLTGVPREALYAAAAAAE